MTWLVELIRKRTVAPRDAGTPLSCSIIIVGPGLIGFQNITFPVAQAQVDLSLGSIGREILLTPYSDPLIIRRVVPLLGGDSGAWSEPCMHSSRNSSSARP